MTENKRIVKFSQEVLELACEWESCTVVEKDMCIFLAHMNTHLNQIQESREIQCMWKDCDLIIKNNFELQRHIMFHAFHTKIKCYGKNFLQRKGLPNCTFDSQNRNVVPELPERLTCYWKDCDEVFDSPEVFYRHVDIHADDHQKVSYKSTLKCQWQDCKGSFGGVNKLRDHLRSHTQEKLMACPVCGGMFASRTKFQDHIIRQATVNDDDDQNVGFECGYCYRKFASERLLRDHMRHHVSHYKCPYCAMTCPNPSSLHSHITYRHSTEKNYSCQYCEYRCKYESDLYKHLETHNNEPAFKCPVENCDYKTRSRACLNCHVNGKHQNGSTKLYKCHICDKAFSRGNYLTKHLMSSHHFHWPSGHCRFRYLRDDDGFFRLQMVRYESIELSEAVLQEEGCEQDKSTIQHSILEKANLENKTSTDSESVKENSVELMKNSENSDIEATTVPMVVYIPNSDNKDDTAKEIIPNEVHSVVLEVHNIENVTASEIPPYVYLNLSNLEKNSNSSRTIHVIENLDGKTIIQTAEVIASASDNNEDISMQ